MNKTLFYLEENKDYQAMDLSYHLFKDLDFRIIKNQTSFYRSDFRGSTFENVFFKRNNFDIADFINCYFTNVDFTEVNLGEAEFKNCFFENSQFRNNNYTNVAIHDCTFYKSVFSGEIFKLSMYNVNFRECIFINCEFDQCSTDSLIFSDCTINNCEMSTMHAENYKIDSCNFINSFLGYCFLGSYLIKNVNFSLIKLKYRGKEIKIQDKNFFYNFSEKLKKEERWFEYLNILLIIGNKIEIYEDFQNVFPRIFENKNINVIKYNLNNMFEMLEYYMGNRISLNSIIHIIGYLNEFSMKKNDKELQAILSNRIFKLEYRLQELDIENINLGIFTNIGTVIDFHFDSNNKHECAQMISTIIKDISVPLHKNLTCNKENYRVLEYRKGSIIIAVAASILICFGLIGVVKTSSDMYFRIKIEKARTDQIIQMYQNSNNLNDLVKIDELQEKHLTFIENINNNEYKKAAKRSASLVKGKLIELIVRFIIK